MSIDWLLAKIRHAKPWEDAVEDTGKRIISRESGCLQSREAIKKADTINLHTQENLNRDCSRQGGVSPGAEFSRNSGKGKSGTAHSE